MRLRWCQHRYYLPYVLHIGRHINILQSCHPVRHSFVNREVAAWIGQPKQKGVKNPKRKPGTVHSNPILGTAVFDLTLFNEVAQSNDTIPNIHAQVIDSCIAVIISRPVIRQQHLVTKFLSTLMRFPAQSQTKANL